MVIRMTVNVSGLIWLILISGSHPGDANLIMVKQSRGEKENSGKRPEKWSQGDG